jgi:hypothetical protein
MNDCLAKNFLLFVMISLNLYNASTQMPSYGVILPSITQQLQPQMLKTILQKAGVAII